MGQLQPRQAYVVDQPIITPGGEWQHQYDFQPDQICIILHTAPAYGLELYMTGTKGGAPIALLSQGPFIVPGVTDNQLIRIVSREAVAITCTVIAQLGYAPTSINAPAITKAAVTPGVYQILVDGANIDWDLNAGSGEVTIAGNRTMSNPTNQAAGTMYFLKAVQDAVGGRTMAWGTNYRFEGGVVPLLSYQPAAADMFEFMSDGTYMMCQRITRNVLAAFSPLSVPQCGIWLDAGQITGLVDGDTIASWPDMSGNARNFAQAVAGQRPVWKTGMLNGLPIARFDGANDLLTSGAYSLALPNTIFLVCCWRGAGAATENFLACAAGSFALYRDGAALGNWIIYTSPNTIAGPACAAGVYKLAEATLEAGSCTLWINGALQGSTANTPAAGVLGLGARPVAVFDYSDSDVAEVIIYNSALSLSQRQSVEIYLRAKYALW